MDKLDLWWTTAQSDPDTLARRLGAYSAINGQQVRGADDFYLAWAYQRDYLIQRLGSLRDALNFGPEGNASHFGWLRGRESVPSPNIVKSVVDTAAAWLVSEAPPIACKASGASFEAQPALERYGAALDAIFNLPAITEVMQKIGRDGLLRGVGWAMPAYENGAVTMRRLLPWQMIYDPVDARYGRPSACMVRSTMDRAVLVEWVLELDVPNKDKIVSKIKDLPAITIRPMDARGHWTVYDYELYDLRDAQASDHVVVWYAWRASSSNRSGDGRYVLAASGSLDGAHAVIVTDEAYEPAEVMPVWWSPYANDEGVGGTGLGHLMIPWQEALDRSFFKLQRSLDKYGHIKIITSSSVYGQLNLQAFAEAGIEVLEADGIAGDRDIPKTYDPQVLRREDIEWIERILTWSSSIYGINQLMQQGTGAAVPSASAVALVERADQTRDRFTDVTRAWTAFRLACADRMLRLLDGVVEVNRSFAVEYDMRGTGASDTWADLTKQVANTAITLEVRGDASQSRAGRLARAVEFGERGFISPDELRELMLDDPDIRKAARESLAGYRLVERQLQGVIQATDGNWWAYQPDEDTPIDLAISKASAVIQRALTEGADDDTVERLREYRLYAEMMRSASQPMAAAPMAPPTQEMTMGAAPEMAPPMGGGMPGGPTL